LKPWLKNFTTSVRTFKNINYDVLPEDKWLLVGLLKNWHKAVLLVVLLPE